MTVVQSAIGAAASGALSGAGGEMGRRSSEALLRLVRRMPDQGDPGSGAGGGTDGQTGLPTTEAERRALAGRLAEHIARDDEFAREAMSWVRTTDWLQPRVIPAVQPTARPQMLLPPAPAFTDREWVLEEIEALTDADDAPQGAPVVVCLTGPGGIGKSATATSCAHVLKDRFPDGQLFVNLGGVAGADAVHPSDVLVRFLARLGVPPGRMPAEPEQLADLYRDCTADRRLLVVLDNATSAAQVLPLLPASSGALVLVTSRRRMDELVRVGARPLVLPPLSAEHSVQLLARIAGREPVGDEEAMARTAVAEQCGGNPLALCMTGAHVAFREHLRWATVGRQLSNRPADAHQGPGMSGDRMSRDGAHAANDLAYRQLDPETATLYRALGVWNWPSITVRAAARAGDVGEADARRLLEELAGVHLIEEIGEERYRFHDLVREHAHGRAEAEDGMTGMQAVIRRVVSDHLAFAAQADLRVVPLRWRLGRAYLRCTLPRPRPAHDGRDALDMLRVERENLAAAVRAATHYGFDDLAWQVCEAMWGLHLRLGFHEQWVSTHQLGAAAARRSAEQFGDPRAVGRVLTQLGFAHMGRGQAREAEQAFTDAAAADEAIGHHRGQASAVEGLGLLHLRLGEGPQAEQRLQEAWVILERLQPSDEGWNDLPRAQALLWHQIGRALSLQDRFADATVRFNEALVKFRDLGRDGGLGDPYNEGRVYMSLGENHLHSGDPRLARVCLDEALTTMTYEGAELQRADALELRASCARRAGDPADEEADLRAAADLYEAREDALSLTRVRARLDELGQAG